MAGTNPGDLHDLAVEVLDACVEALDTIPDFEPGFVGAPARRFVSPGKPAYDCCDGEEHGQLTVHVSPVVEGPHEKQTNSFVYRTNRVRVNITSLRCIGMDPDGNPPDPDVATAQAAQLNRDGWAIWNHLFNLQRADLIFTQCGEVIWGQLTAVDPSGLCGGWTLPITVSLDGYEETFGT